jgi:hypothetical protein
MCNHKGKCFGACGTTRSAAEIANSQNNEAKRLRQEAHARSNHPGDEGKMHEHDRVQSRLGGKSKEISMGPHGGGLVPANPFASLAQEGYLHAHPEKLGKAGLEEWDEATKGKKLPEHVKHAK